jgi:hypothetical protein
MLCFLLMIVAFCYVQNYKTNYTSLLCVSKSKTQIIRSLVYSAFVLVTAPYNLRQWVYV